MMFIDACILYHLTKHNSSFPSDINIGHIVRTSYFSTLFEQTITCSFSLWLSSVHSPSHRLYTSIHPPVPFPPWSCPSARLSHHNNGGRSLDPNSQIDWSAWNAWWILVAWSHLEPATEKKDRPFQVVEFMASTGADDPNTIRNMAVCPYSSAQWHTCPVKHIWSPVPGLSQQAKATRWISTQLYYTTRFCRNLQVIDLWRRWFVEVGHSGHTLRDWKQEIRNWWYFNWCWFRKIGET